jgi:hypothetical protein
MALTTVPFAEPVLHGNRFDGAAIPVDVLPDLSAYRDLVVEVAKEMYRVRHKRERVPRGFVERFQLRLVGIGEGSAAPRLARVVPEAAWLPFDRLGHLDEFDEARDLINDSIEMFATSGQLPKSFPPTALRLFNSVGKRLRPGEYIEFRRPDQKHGPAYTPDVRKRLVLLTSDRYSREVELSGSVEGIIRATRRIRGTRRLFDLRTLELGTIQVPFRASDEHLVASAWEDHRFVRVQVVGIAVFDRKDRFKKFESVPTVTLVSDLDEESVKDVETRLQELGALEPGWFDGDGESLPSAGIRWLRTLLLAVISQGDVPVPRIFPTPEGGIQVEWSIGDWEVAADFNLVTKAVAVHATNMRSREHRSDAFALSEDVEHGEAMFGRFLEDLRITD